MTIIALLMLREDINGMDSGSAIPSTSREDFYRFAAHSFLNERRKVAVCLIPVDFVGDFRGPARKSPRSRRDWDAALQAQASHVGLPPDHSLKHRVHKPFLPVARESA